MINCSECPRCKDTYPDEVDYYGNHFCICGLSGNMVYTTPRKEKRIFGSGYIHHPVSGCGLYETVVDALTDMTQAERKDYVRNRISAVSDAD